MLTKAYILFISTLLLFKLGNSLETCPTAGSTLYDGYLSSKIQYAYFSKDQGSYFKIPNPFQGLTLNTYSALFWAKLPIVTDDGAFSTGMFVDCSDTLALRLENSKVKFSIANS